MRAIASKPPAAVMRSKFFVVAPEISRKFLKTACALAEEDSTTTPSVQFTTVITSTIEISVEMSAILIPAALGPVAPRIVNP